MTLDGVIMKCNANPDQARNDSDCLNARIALERLAKDTAPAEEAKRSIEFERSREALRQTQERMRKDQEARTTVDAYNLPVMPIYPVPSPSGDSAAQPKP